MGSLDNSIDSSLDSSVNSSVNSGIDIDNGISGLDTGLSGGLEHNIKESLEQDLAEGKSGIEPPEAANISAQSSDTAQETLEENLEFYSQSTLCRGRLYLPRGVKNPPVILMGHGFAAQMDFKLPDFARHFVKAGFAAFAFDYRGFGESEGKVRNLVAPHRHLKDWKNALAFVRTLEQVDTSRIFLWGSSFGGGLALVTAAREKNIKGVISQIPFVDPISTLQMLGPVFLTKAVVHALRDIFRILTFREPYYVPVVGRPHEFAAMNTPESYDGYHSILPEGSHWQNRCPARIFLTLLPFRPLSYARKIKCPALVVMGEKDSLCAASAVRKTAGRIPDGDLLSLDCAHFDIYHGEYFKQAAGRELEFLQGIINRQ